MSRSLVCICNVVTEKEILAKLKRGASTTSEIQNLTGAGTSCGKCLTTVDRIVDDFLSQQPVDPQCKLNFDGQ